MNIIIPEISEIVNFFTPAIIEKIAKETGFVQRESKLGGIEFLILMTQGLYAKPDGRDMEGYKSQSGDKWTRHTTANSQWHRISETDAIKSITAINNQVISG